MPGFVIGGEGGPARTSLGPNRDWLRSHRFQLVNFFGQKAVSSTADASDSAPEFVMVKDVVMPDKKMSMLKVKTPGTTYSFASQAEYTDLKITFYGSRALLTKCYQMADKVHNTREGLRDYHQYKGELVFRLFDHFTRPFSIAGLTVPIPVTASGIEYSYKNAYISHVQHGQVSYTSSEIMSITATVPFDFFDVKFLEFDSAGALVVSNSQQPADLLETYNGEATR